MNAVEILYLATPVAVFIISKILSKIPINIKVDNTAITIKSF